MMIVLALSLMLALGRACTVNLSGRRLTASNVRTAFNNAVQRSSCSMNTVRVLNLENNNLASLPLGFFSNMPNLRELDLEHNQISQLPLGALNNRNLVKLELDNNRLTSIPMSFLSNLPALDELDLESNALSSLPSSVFSRNPRLRYIDLESNALASIPMSLFSRNQMLQEVDLESNQLSSVAMSLFTNLPALRSVDLSENLFRSRPTVQVHRDARVAVRTDWGTATVGRRRREGEAAEAPADNTLENTSEHTQVWLKRILGFTLCGLFVSVVVWLWRKKQPHVSSESGEPTELLASHLMDEEAPAALLV